MFKHEEFDAVYDMVQNNNMYKHSSKKIIKIKDALKGIASEVTK